MIMTQHAELLPRYKRLREAGLELNTRLVQALPAAPSMRGASGWGS